MSCGDGGISRRTALRTTGTALGAATAGCLTAVRDAVSPGGGDAWSQYRADARNSGIAPESGPGTGLSKAWTWEDADGEVASTTRKRWLSPPVSDGQRAYLTVVLEPSRGRDAETLADLAEDGLPGEGALVALDLADGAVAWATEPGRFRRATPSAPAVDGDTVYVAGRKKLVAVDRADGSVRWAVELPAPGVSAPTVADGTVYVGSATLLAVDGADGSLEWHYEHPGGEADDARSVSGVGPDPVPAVGQDTVYLPVGSRLHAVDREAGDARWVERVAREDPVTEGPRDLFAPVLDDGTLYVTAWANVTLGTGYLAAVDAASGAREWAFAAGLDFESYRGSPGVLGAFGSPLVHDGSVYVCGRAPGEDPSVFELDADAGDRLATGRLSDELPPVPAQPVFADGTVYLVATRGVYAFDRNLEERTRREPQGENATLAPPALAGGRLLVPRRNSVDAYAG